MGAERVPRKLGGIWLPASVGRERGERAHARCRSRGTLSEWKESPLTIPLETFWGRLHRHKLHIPRRCPKGTGSLIPLLLLFPPQKSLRWEPCFRPQTPPTTKGRAAALPLETIPEGTGDFRETGVGASLRAYGGRGTMVRGGVRAVMQGSLRGTGLGMAW